jgi:hypothetical protein
MSILLLQLEDGMRQIIRIQWLGESNDGPGLKLYCTYFHPECAAYNYPNAVARALMGERVDMSHLHSHVKTVDALPAKPLLDWIACDLCSEPVPQAPSFNTELDMG